MGGLTRLADGRTAWLAAPPEARLRSRTRVEWRASRIGRHWAERAPKRFVVVFDGVDLGEGMVTSFGRDDWRTAVARVALTSPVEPRAWETLGWQGFGLRVGAPERLGVGAAEVRDEVARALASGAADLDVATPDDEVLVMLVSGDRAFVMHVEPPDDVGMVALDPAARAGVVEFTLDNGQVDEFDRRSTVTHDVALRALETFLAGRGRAGDIAWSDELAG